MPSLGADMESGTLLEWLVKPGDTVRRGDPIAVVDTDKAAIEVESFHDGVVGDLLVQPGTRVAVGAPMARIESAQAPSSLVAPPVAAHPGAASPPVRHRAAELGVDLARVVGTGPHGRIRREDVDAAARAAAPPTAVRAEAAPVPAVTPPVTSAGAGRRRASPYARRLAEQLGVDLDTLGTGDRPVTAAAVRAGAATAPAQVPVAARPPEAGAAPPGRRTGPAAATHKPGRGAIGALMRRSKREVPHYYVATTVDLAAVTGWLRRTNRDRLVGERIVPTAAILKATALALRRTPALNGFWVDDDFQPADVVHLGVAVSVRDGALVAPAIHHAADRSLPEVMNALRDVVRRARTGRLTRAEMADPTFTVTDLGEQGVEEVIGVIYPPQVALLGVGRVVERPWAVDGMLAVRPVVRLTLSGDHRVTDGAAGARFLNLVDGLLQEPEEL
jgi:pyruvate dehydrogenase E2 component (dihydrolipoamide acetyltransferase)